LLQGNFTYNDFGLLDRTHLRFFDKNSIANLFENAGLEIVSLRSVYRDFNVVEVKFDISKVHPDLMKSLENDLEAKTYQYSVVGVPKTSKLATNFPIMPLAYLQDMLLSEQNTKDHYIKECEILRGEVLRLGELRTSLEAQISQKDQELSSLSPRIKRLDRIESNFAFKIALMFRKSIIKMLSKLQGR
jgi:hypothetical protein